MYIVCAHPVQPITKYYQQVFSCPTIACAKKMTLQRFNH